VIYTDVDLKEVLELINRCRQACGLTTLESIPKGRVRDLCGCPFAKAFSDCGVVISVTESCISWVESACAQPMADVLEATSEPMGNGTFTVSLPPLLKKFIINFDQNSYPELIA